MATKKMTAEQKALYKQMTPTQKKHCDSLDNNGRENYFNKAKNAFRMRIIVRENLYPIILDAVNSVNDVKTFSGIIEMTINQAFAKLVETMKVKELGILEKLDDKAPNSNEYKRFFNLMNDETVKDCLDMLKGFPKYIDNITEEKLSKDLFKDLVINWDKA